MPQGDRRKDIDLHDSIYDGDVVPPSSSSTVITSGPTSGSSISEMGVLLAPMRLVGGLGQLTDSDEGQSNFRLDPRGIGFKGQSATPSRLSTVKYCNKL